jgi:hypothetical protein
MAYYRVRIEVWCDWNPGSDLDDIGGWPTFRGFRNVGLLDSILLQIGKLSAGS